ncbi:MAG: TIGR01777 family oxidoreductase [Cellvibrionaceae bacterium]|nr:TIGR01777 family oxidoreductase [Cellvibrionaceae bacterium]
MHILLTGASGFIAQALIPKLLERGYQLSAWSCSPHIIQRRYDGRVQALAELSQLSELAPVDGVINLAGAGIADKRWSPTRKQLLLDSRLNTTRALVTAMQTWPRPPRVLLSGSAIGFYGSQEGDHQLLEDAQVADGFTHQLCQQWEAAALQAESLGVRVCLLRTAVVLGPGGGALAKMLPPFRLGLGGPIGSGEQWMSWIHIDDQVKAILFLLDHRDCYGAYNLSAPGAVQNSDFANRLGRALGRPAVLPLPALVPKLMLGEGAELLLEGQRVYPERLLQAGFEFRYPGLAEALAACTA